MVQFIFNKYFFIGKLLSRSQKIAYNLLKLGPKNDPIVRPGHRVSDYTFSTCPAPLPNMPYSPFKHARDALLSFQTRPTLLSTCLTLPRCIRACLVRSGGARLPQQRSARLPLCFLWLSHGWSRSLAHRSAHLKKSEFSHT